MSNAMRAANLSSALANKPVLFHEQTVLQECQGRGRKRKKSKERGRKHGTRKRPKHTQVDSVLRRVKADEEEDPVYRGEKYSRSLNEISISGAQGEKHDVRVKSGGPEREGLGFGERDSRRDARRDGSGCWRLVKGFGKWVKIPWTEQRIVRLRMSNRIMRLKVMTTM
ncbi:MAG: hypothetical protein M1830_007651 [Pleopsidium flavum]|nr:MAG: hypothetical protein M1830_007651 [Pleopsidium flavum]